ncbi:MAG: hypothetical protein CMK74_02185 [Pseudomonadales bacterium]|nr:hypothetical protein [Pseudomonadales bacterium]|tara:strand:- start:751 stop:963 length:213 start_codon:yes stop_codon:yes gene_type:complete
MPKKAQVKLGTRYVTITRETKYVYSVDGCDTDAAAEETAHARLRQSAPIGLVDEKAEVTNTATSFKKPTL